MLKKCSIVLLKSALIFIVSIVFAVLFMFLAYLLPTSKMQNSAKSSSEILLKEGNYNYLVEGDFSSRLDNFTDSIMISEAIFDSDESAIYKAMKNYHSGWGVEGLDAQVDGDVDEKSYSRYWNGYLIFLKPLLLMFGIKGIRILNTVLQILLVIGVCCVMFKKAKSLIIPYLISLFLINPVAITQSMQFSSVFYIFNITMLLVLLFNEKLNQKNWFGYLFLIVGIVTSFFDFLTYPVATFLMPLVVVMWFDESSTFKDKFITALKLGVFWAVGYFGFWIAKWCVGSIVTGENLITEAIKQAKFRTTGDVSYAPSKILVHLAFVLNFKPFINLQNIVLLSVCLCLLLVLILKYRKQFSITKTKVLSFLLVAVLPILWYLVLSNHSYMHYWFTFRSYIGTIFAVITLMAYGFKNLKFKKEEKSNENEDSSITTML